MTARNDTAGRSRPAFALALLVMLLLLLEVIPRVFFSISRGTADFLFFPRKARAQIELGRAEPLPEVELPKDHDGMKALKEGLKDRLRLPPGSCRFFTAAGTPHLVPINRNGFRGKDFADRGDARLLMTTLGGSSTFCAECPVGESWPERVEALINERYGSNTVCVVNRSMLGMRPDQVANLFCSEIVKQPVDLVLVCSAFNAIEPPMVMDMRPESTIWITRLLWGRSLLYTTLYNWRAGRAQTQADEEVKRLYRADLERMVEAARHRAIRLVFVLQPLLDPGPQTVRGDVGYIPAALARRQLAEMGALLPMHNELLAIMSDVAQRADIPVCDPRAAVLRDDSAADNFVLCLHLTPGGADKMANAVVNGIAEMLRTPSSASSTPEGISP